MPVKHLHRIATLRNHPITVAAVVAGSLAEAAYQDEEVRKRESVHQEEASQAEQVEADQAYQDVERRLVVVDPSSSGEGEPLASARTAQAEVPDTDQEVVEQTEAASVEVVRGASAAVDPVRGKASVQVESQEPAGSSSAEQTYSEQEVEKSAAASCLEQGHQFPEPVQINPVELELKAQLGFHGQQHDQDRDRPTQPLLQPWHGSHQVAEGLQQSWRSPLRLSKERDRESACPRVLHSFLHL